MSRIGSTIAAALVASPLFIAAPGRAQTVMPAPAPQTEAMPDSVPLPKPNQFTLGCALYSNTLTLMGQMHLHGSLVLTPQQLASVGAEGILYAGHARVVSHTPKGQESGSKLNLEGKEKIISWTLNDKTIEAGTPPVTIQTNVDACTYLGNLALQVSNASHVPVYSLFEEATAFATEKAVPADTHSGYSPGVEADSMREEMRGEFAGVGMTVSKTPGSPLVAEKVMKDSPSAKAGILDGDKITDIDGESILPMNSQEAVNLLRGPKDSKVKLTVQRGDGAPFTVDVTRDIVVQRSVEGFLLEGSDIGVIKIANFMNEKTTDQLLETAVDIAMQAHKQGKVIRHFVIRVEENPGGLITQGELVSDLFVNSDPRGEQKRLVSTGKSPHDLDEAVFADHVLPFDLYQYIKSKLPPEAGIQPFTIAVLQNGGSASASEIFAGATQDAGIPVIGTRSYGKGTMQVVMPMNKDGTPARYESQVHGILRVTTDAFFPGSGPAQSLVVPPGLSLPKDFPLPKLSDVGRSNLGSGIIPNILVRTGDERDQYEDERPKEQPGLLDAGLTRAADKPVSVCTVVPELRGELSPELQAQLPKELIISFPKKDKLTGAWTRVKMLDANLACAVSLYDDTGLVDFDYYKEPASVPAQAPAVVPAPAP